MIEIIIGIVVLSSFIGLILFGILYLRYLKKHRAKKLSQKITIAVSKKGKQPKVEDYSNNIDIYWLTNKLFRILPMLIFIGTSIIIINILFNPFGQSADQQPQPQVQPQPQNISLNQSIFVAMVESITPEGVPWWFTLGLALVPLWMLWRIFIRSGSYDL